MNVLKLYKDNIINLIENVYQEQEDNMKKSINFIADALEQDGLIHTFGTGHSHLVAEEVVYRAGGLAPVNSMLEPSLTGHQHVTKSEYTERMEGWGEIILNYHQPDEKDVIIVISNSGRNAAPVEVAREAQRRNITVIAIVSYEYCSNIDSRHPSGEKLIDVADIIIDNGTTKGDARIELEDLEVPVGPESNISAFYIIHSLMLGAINELLKRGKKPPVFLSGNLDEGRNYNKELIEKYWSRIKVY